MANSNQTTGINVEKIDSCILELTNYIEKLKSIFLRLDDAVSSTVEFYRCDGADDYRRKYSVFKDNYNIIIANLSSYIDELKYVKLNYALLSQELSGNIAKSAVDLESGYDRYQG